MSRTLKREYSNPDGWHVGRRLERRARPAGRMLGILEAEAAAEGDDEALDDLLALHAYEDELADVLAQPADDGPDGYNSRCGCYCRRCLLHDDCGGCVEVGGHP